jgi:hypothetical protein
MTRKTAIEPGRARIIAALNHDMVRAGQYAISDDGPIEVQCLRPLTFS